MTPIICLWKSLSCGLPSQLLFGEGNVAHCYVPVWNQSLSVRLRKEASLCGTPPLQQHQIWLMQIRTYHQLEWDLKLPPPVKIRIRSFHSNLSERGGTKSVHKIHKSSKVLDLATVRWDESTPGHRSCQLASIDECGAVIIWWAFLVCRRCMHHTLNSLITEHCLPFLFVVVARG